MAQKRYTHYFSPFSNFQPPAPGFTTTISGLDCMVHLVVDSSDVTFITSQLCVNEHLPLRETERD